MKRSHYGCRVFLLALTVAFTAPAEAQEIEDIVDGLGFDELGEPMTLENFRAVFSGPLISNLGYTQDTAEAAIARGSVDLIAIGRSFITKPDLVERYRHGWPLLVACSDPSTWYGGFSGGHTNFLAYEL